MRKHNHLAASAAIVGIALASHLRLKPQSVAAHEIRATAGGKYQVAAGFLTEPIYQGQINGLSLAVINTIGENDDGGTEPSEGSDKTLKAQIFAVGKTLDLTVQARFGLAGSYADYFQPTAAGQYRVRVDGTINGDQIDEMFEPCPGRVTDVESIARLQFPSQVPTVPGGVQAQLDSARGAAAITRLIAIAGVVIGPLGLVVGGLALLRARAGGTRREGA